MGNNQSPFSTLVLEESITMPVFSSSQADCEKAAQKQLNIAKERCESGDESGDA
jgi:hypothetical protein